jgi:hypothetical protein
VGKGKGRSESEAKKGPGSTARFIFLVFFLWRFGAPLTEKRPKTRLKFKEIEERENRFYGLFCRFSISFVKLFDTIFCKNIFMVFLNSPYTEKRPKTH